MTVSLKPAVAWIAIVVSLSFLCACDNGNGSGDGDDENLARWLMDRPRLQNRSLWQQSIDMADPPGPRALGCIAVGNGRVYGNIGNQYPLASWHNLGGPTYQTDLEWFSDKVPRLVAGGIVQEPDHQTISRVRNSAVVIVTAANEAFEWTSVNFAPLYPSDPLVEQALVSVWIVRNLGDDVAVDVRLEIASTLGRVTGGELVESDWENRLLTLRPLGADAHPGDSPKDLVIPMGDMPPGGERTVSLPLVFTCRHGDAGEIFSAIADAGIDVLLDSTLDGWDAWASQIAVIDTPDEKFNDLMRGLAVSIRINQAVSGGVSEMNQYSHTWLRDIHGPSLYCPLIGLAGDYREMVDYLWGAILVHGDIANALELDLDVSNLPPQPDWEGLGEMDGRTRAEGPSLLVLEYENDYKATGDLAPIAERWGMLRHAVVDQKYVDGCLLHFSSDETFEDLMEVAFGENFLEEPDESTLSLYSSLLAIRAAAFMAEMAGLLGYDEDAATFSVLAEEVTLCLEETFWIEEEGFYAVKVQTDTGEPHLQPYEDVSTMPLWLDALPVDGARVASNFEAVMERLGHADGLLYSSIPSPYSLVFHNIERGVLTGMSHGYWLNNLDKMFHPAADTAFSRWPDVFSRTGFTDEAVVVDDFSHLTIFREPFGFVCDVSSRFRSWESGVMGFALLHHLTGFDRSVPGGWVRLAPQLPPEWDEMRFAGLAFGDGRIDVEVERQGDEGRTITVVTDENASFDLTLTVPLTGDVTGATLNGDALDPAGYDWETNAYGRTVVVFDPIEVEAGSRVEITIEVETLE